MKKLIFFILSCLLNVATFAQSGTTGDLSWSISDGTLSISGMGAMPDYGGRSSPWGLHPGSIVRGYNSPWYVYRDCIVDVIISEEVTNIGKGAFADCSFLTSINIPHSATYIGVEAFAYCVSLSSIIIPHSVISINNLAFAWCSGLTSVIIPNSVTYIGDLAFAGCNGLTFINIPNSVTSIGHMAFARCERLTSITIPNSVITIGEGAFILCLDLVSVTIPNSVNSFGKNAFSRCRNLTEIINHASTPPKIKSNVFKKVKKSKCVLRVPAASVNAYRNAKVWKDFKIEGF